MKQLSAKQYAPLAENEQQAFRTEASKRGIGSGLLARALLLDGLDRLGEPAVERRIDDEKAATKDRIREGARAAAQQRWAGDEGAK